MRVLFDTNAIAYWLGGEPSFKPALSGLVRKLRKQKAAFYVSPILSRQDRTGEHVRLSSEGQHRPQGMNSGHDSRWAQATQKTQPTVRA